MRAIKVSVEGDVFEVNATLDILFPEDNWTWDYAEAFGDYGMTQGLPIIVYETYDMGGRMIPNKLASSINIRERRGGRAVSLWGDVYLFNRDTVGATADIISLQDDITVAVVRERIEEARRAER